MSVVDDYLADVDEPRRAQLRRIRQLVWESVPDVVEAKSYGVPAFKVDGRPLLGFSAAKQHLSLYPFSPAVVEALQDDLTGYDVAKGTIRFAAENPISDQLVRSMIALRLAEIRPSTT